MRSVLFSRYDEAVLAALICRGTPVSAAQVNETIAERLDGNPLPPGVLYPTLNRLMANGLIVAESIAGNERSGGRSLRLFEITPDGLEAAATTRAMSRRLWDGVCDDNQHT